MVLLASRTLGQTFISVSMDCMSVTKTYKILIWEISAQVSQNTSLIMLSTICGEMNKIGN